MSLESNVGGLDRIVRGVLGVTLLLVAAAMAAAESWALAGMLSAGGVALLFNAATQFCAINALLGVNTCSTREG